MTTPAFNRRAYVLTAAPRSIVVARKPANLTRKRALVAVPLAIALVGKTATLRSVRKMKAVVGVVSLAGRVTALHRGRVLKAQAGSVTVTPRAAALRVKLKLTATKITIVLTGLQVGLSTSHKLQLAVDNGALLVSGAATNLAVGRNWRCMADSGVALLSGQPAALRLTASVPALSGTFILTGSSAGLGVYPGLRFVTTSVELQLIVQPVVLSREIHARVPTRGALVDGSDTDLLHGAMNVFELTAEPGSIVIIGMTAALSIEHGSLPDLPPGVFHPTRRAFIPNRW